MLSTEEAAKQLGITRRRVQELVKSGILDAQKVSGVWLVSEESVARRAKDAVKNGGRPTRGKARAETTFTLMNRGHEIAKLVYNTARKTFTYVGELIDALRVPIGITDAKGSISKDAFNAWWRGRGIPSTRVRLASLLSDAGVELPEELLHRNLGLSLSDQYWIRPENSGLEWQDINFFTNDFEKVSLETEAFAVEGQKAAAKPDNTSDGNLEKCWVCRDGIRTLLKGGTTYGQEPYNEAIATALHKRLLAKTEYVPYALEGNGATALCSCPNFLSDTEEYIPAFYVGRCLQENADQNDYEHYIGCCESLEVQGAVDALDRMIVCDDILANHDRHYRNFGVIRNVETLTCRPAPIFDSGSSLWCDVPTKLLAGGEHSFLSKQFYESPAKQMLLVNSLDWFDPDSLRGFVDEACEILSANDALKVRLPYIRAALEWRVHRMINIVEWD